MQTCHLCGQLTTTACFPTSKFGPHLLVQACRQCASIHQLDTPAPTPHGSDASTGAEVANDGQTLADLHAQMQACFQFQQGQIRQSQGFSERLARTEMAGSNQQHLLNLLQQGVAQNAKDIKEEVSERKALEVRAKDIKEEVSE